MARTREGTRWFGQAVTIVTLASVLGACSVPPSCSDHFVGGRPPVVNSESLARQTRQLCYAEFALLHSGVSRTPVWSAEHLTAARVEAAHTLKRVNAFHAETLLPQEERAELADYSRSGYDRGHMSPSGDMGDEQAQHESFTLANMIPQHPKNNQILWAGIEEATRALALADHELYVVTGPIFEGTAIEQLNGRVLVPTAVYKAIYDPAKNQAAAYVTPNAPGKEYQILSIGELEQRIHIDVFPALTPERKADKLALPAPMAHGGHSRQRSPVETQ